jgi:ornithine cyclodeaminase/alanine dehydrogenase-like protein (mu-crystallin family)
VSGIVTAVIDIDPLKDLRIVRRDVIAEAMPMRDCIEIVDQTMQTVSVGGATMPLRMTMQIGDGDDRLGVMPGALSLPPAMGVKLLALYPGNPLNGLSSHLGMVLLFNRQNGLPWAVLDAAALTRLRTAAASAVATRALAREDATTLAIIGTGEQAEAHLEAIPIIRPISNTNLH